MCNAIVKLAKLKGLTKENSKLKYVTESTSKRPHYARKFMMAF